jgi:hypothetical protein
MSQSEVVIPELDQTLQIRMGRNPSTVIEEAAICAKALMGAVQKNEWAIYLGGKKPHLMFVAWAFLATMYRVTPRVVSGSTRLVEIGGVIGFEAEAEAFHIPSQSIISTGNAMCLNDEENWGLRPKYEGKGENRRKIGEVPVPLFQLRSMAQTRAKAHALKGPFSWIVAMAGYSPTTAENITGPAPDAAANQRMRPPQQKESPQSTASDAPAKITERQASRIWGLAHSANKPKEEVIRILKHFGFEQAADVTVDVYEQICVEVQKGDAQ